MDNPDSHISAASASTHAASVESTLNELRARNRLAIHIFEQHHDFTFPDFSYNAINTLKAENIRPAMGNRNVPYPMLSMTFLPSIANVEMYDGINNVLPAAAYLVDLDQSRENPATVFHVHERSLMSGDDPYEKMHKFDDGSFWDKALDRYYERWERRWDRSLAMAADTQGRLTEEQLGLLASTYLDKQEPDIFPNRMNEILTVCSAEHLSAIAVTSRAKRTTLSPVEEAVQNYNAALMGMLHENAGIHLPVMRYYVNDDPKQSIEYLAQGKDELKAMMTQSLQAILSHSEYCDEHYYHPDDFIKHANNVFGCDFVAEILSAGNGRT